MKSLLAILFFILTLSTTLLCENKAAEQAATESANHWLAEVDAGRYAASWDAAAPAFKSAVSKDQWAKALASTRSPLGKVISRTVKSAAHTATLPGAPDGQDVVIQYESSLEHKETAIETVASSLGDDGQWKVSGYYIR
jgi:Protein of unknown function (DUF4019)